MATILLSAAGFAAGSALGGSVLGLSSAVIGRAIGATLGRVIDQKLLGRGSEAIETGRIDRFRLTGASEGAPIGRVFGRVRLGGQVIWATDFQESVSTSGGGKGGPPQPKTRSYSYSVSLAVALCEGEILRVGRIWADGSEISPQDYNIRVYKGSEQQLPDAKIEAVEGAGKAPAFRGVAYVVFEDLPLQAFGNRVPQFSFEVVRAVAEETESADGVSLSRVVKAVALVPGTGEYALATTPVHFSDGPGQNRSANVNAPAGGTDFEVSIRALDEELPACQSTSLIVSWFGDDLRCGECELRPKVEQTQQDGVGMPWQVSGLPRADALEIARENGRPIYGGTPADASVIEAIQGLRENGQKVMFYPFILMEQGEGNSLPDPYTAFPGQPVLPWRGRITTSLAPGVSGTPDKTSAAEAEVASFMGIAAASDFTASGQTVIYSGPNEWSYRRFILHYAHLCALAGGVDAFCIGSEMRGLTQIRGANGSFPAVDALRALAVEVRTILGPETKLSYAADWSEYFGYHPQDGSGDVYFHLDPLWADEAIDFIGIDNYMPLSDWRDGIEHADAHWGSIHNLGYLTANVAGGEGYDWYYSNPNAREAQLRSPIADGAHDEAWVFRYKDLKGWWDNRHHNRVGGVRSQNPTAWEPQSKPFWFTELGCAAIDKATNQPNKFLDPKSSESKLAYYSDGTRDDFIQGQYLRAISRHFEDENNNPVSKVYGASMVDMSNAHVWAWDARPYPYFPARRDLWSDGENYARGHWLNGRTSSESLAAVVAEVCETSDVSLPDVSGLYGQVRGYGLDDAPDARSALQPLMLAYGFDAVERDGALRFETRDGNPDIEVATDTCVVSGELDGLLEFTRDPQAETAGRVRLNYIEDDGNFELRAEEAVMADEPTLSVAQSELPLVLTRTEARTIVERWLAESRIARDSVRLSLPPSQIEVGAGDVIALNSEAGVDLYRADHVEHGEAQLIEAVRVDPNVYVASDGVDAPLSAKPFVAATPVHAVFLDLPLITGEETPHAPFVAVSASPWPGSASVYSAPQDSGYRLNRQVTRAAVMGVTRNEMRAVAPGVWDRGPALRVQISGGDLASESKDAVLNGANAMAIGDPSIGVWEVFQFAQAEIVEVGVYDLSLRLRGQQGTDGVMPEVWPIGSTVVLLNETIGQIELASSARGLARFYRVGPGTVGYDDPSYQLAVEAFEGNGLRPYRPTHLRTYADSVGNLTVVWTRRTRVDGDSWIAPEVPLGEARESYGLRVVKDGIVLANHTVPHPRWSYSAAAQIADGAIAPFEIQVAQMSEKFGLGPYERIEIDV